MDTAPDIDSCMFKILQGNYHIPLITQIKNIRVVRSHFNAKKIKFLVFDLLFAYPWQIDVSKMLKKGL
jgi:hypothetical protein